MAKDTTNDDGIQGQIREHMEAKSTEELQRIYQKDDRAEFSELAFVVIRQVLKERSEDQSLEPSSLIPSQESHEEAMGASTAADPPVDNPYSVTRESPEPVDSGGKDWDEFFSFRKMISVPWIKFNYVLGQIAIILFSTWLFFRGLDEDGKMLGYALVILGVGTLAWRLFCEAWIVFFSIHEALVSIDKKTKRG